MVLTDDNVAFQQLPVALGKQCLPRDYNSLKTHALASVSSYNWATCTVIMQLDLF